LHSMTNQYNCDVLILGSGAAGLSAALHLADHARVLVLSKTEIQGGSTNRAQGGIAAVTDPKDSLQNHIQDTIDVGAGLCDEHIVRFAVTQGPRAIDRLIKQGIRFDRTEFAEADTQFHLTQEGGHSHRRVLHIKDKTGHAIESALVSRAIEHSNIELLSDRIAIDVITSEKLGMAANRVVGAYVYHEDSGAVELIQAPYVILATGGASKVYLYTTNPDGATGDGIAMAWRAGCRVGNMEFNQFHPTSLFHSRAKSFLISETVRGEGGRLLLPTGERFMPKFDARGELASRDVVARAIDYEMKRLGTDCVYLDISFRTRNFIESHFPTIHQKCLEFGIDMTKEPIPVVPAAHYTCGGVIVDFNGATDVRGLYAIGETACTGLHGANRLASNSLLECLVFADSAASHITSALLVDDKNLPALPEWDESRVTDSDEEVVLSHNWDELRRFMWDYVGIVRTNKRLERAHHRIELLKQEVHDYYANHRVSNDLIELRNLIHVAELMVRAAISRHESRGLHYTLDYPSTLERALPSVLYPEIDPLDVLQPVSSAARQGRIKRQDPQTRT
jgi:L-aspartate oxidase